MDTACDLFAKDTVVIWPGAEPRGWDQQCGALRDLIEEGEVAYRAPDVQEVIVDGDLATVRVVWTAVSAGDEGQVLEVENGVDVFGRGADRVWRIHVNHAFPETG